MHSPSVSFSSVIRVRTARRDAPGERGSGQQGHSNSEIRGVLGHRGSQCRPASVHCGSMARRGAARRGAKGRTLRTRCSELRAVSIREEARTRGFDDTLSRIVYR